jgi:hypothetical protein
MTPLTRDTLLTALARHIGEGRGVRIGQLVYEASGQYSTPGAERRARQTIEQLRRAGHHICAHPATGYYLAETPEELDRTCQFLYARAMATLAQIAAMKRVALPDLRGQLRLPT